MVKSFTTEQAAADREQIQGDLIAINGEPVGPWLIENIRSRVDPILRARKDVILAVWVGESMVDIIMDQTSDQTITITPFED